MRHQFERFALIPKNLRCFRNRRLSQTGYDRALLDRHRTCRRDNRFVFLAEDHAAYLRLEIVFVLHELLSQMRAGKFQGGKLVMIVRTARCRKRFVADRVVTRRSGRVQRFSGATDFAVSFEI